MSRRGIWFAAAVIISSAATIGAAFADDDAEKEVTKQTTRQISSAIVSRVGSIDAATPSNAINFWSTTSYNSITVRLGQTNIAGATPGTVSSIRIPDFSLNLFEELVGVDTRRGQFVFGVSEAIAYTDGSQGGTSISTPSSSSTLGGITFTTPSSSFTQGSTQLRGVSFTTSPYAAFVLNQYAFLTAVAGYTYGANWMKTGDMTQTTAAAPPFIPKMTTTTRGSTTTSSTDTLFADLSANGIYQIPDTQWTVSGRAGGRYYYGWTSTNVSGSSSNGAGGAALYTAIEARYAIDAITPYVRAQYEYGIAINGGKNNSTVFLGAGVDYVFTPKLVAGLDFMVQQGDPSIQNWQIALNIRARF